MNRRPAYATGDFWCIVIILVVICFVTSTCSGEGTDPRVRITVICTDGTLSIGSGAMVKWNDEPRVALTASHIFDDGVKRISVCVTDRGCFPAELIGRDEENDLAAVRLVGLMDYSVYPIAESDPPSGAVVELHGYGNTQAGDPKSFTGRVAGYGSFRREGGDELLLITVPVRNGDSGGPVTVKGGVVGVVSGSEGGGRGDGGGASRMVTYNSGVEWATVAPTCSRIRAFLGQLFPRIAARPPPGRRIGPPVGTVPGNGLPPGFVREPYADENGVLSKWRDRYPGIALPGPAVIGPWAIGTPLVKTAPAKPEERPPEIVIPVPTGPIEPNLEDYKTPTPGSTPIQPGPMVPVAPVKDSLEEIQDKAEPWKPMPKSTPPTPPGLVDVLAQTDLTELTGRMGSLETTITLLGDRLAETLAKTIAAKVKTPPAVQATELPAIKTNPPIEKQGGIPWDLLGLGLASALGIGVPTWAVMRLRGEGRTSAPTKGTHTTVVVDAPPAADRTYIESHFINVESDHYQRAHELARQQIVRRYPGSQEIIEAELSLTRQYAAGLPQT